MKRIDIMEFDPQDLHACIWEPDGPKEAIKGVIAAVHGLGSNAERGFHYFGPFMADLGWTVVAIDMPGFGNWKPLKERGKKKHWKMIPRAISGLLKMSRDLVPDGPLVLFGSSLGGLNIIDNVLNHPQDTGPAISAVVTLVPAFQQFSIPWYLMIGAGIMLVFYPGFRVNVEKYFLDLKSHDPDSIIMKEDPLALETLALNFLFQIFKTMRKVGPKGGGMKRWDPSIPIFLASASMDALLKNKSVEEFYKGLPEGTIAEHRHYENCYHSLLNELNREEIFGDINSFLEKALKT